MNRQQQKALEKLLKQKPEIGVPMTGDIAVQLVGVRVVSPSGIIKKEIGNFSDVGKERDN